MVELFSTVNSSQICQNKALFTHADIQPDTDIQKYRPNIILTCTVTLSGRMGAEPIQPNILFSNTKKYWANILEYQYRAEYRHVWTRL